MRPMYVAATRAHGAGAAAGPLTRFAASIASICLLALVACPAAARAAAPAPCDGVAQITDARGDGHHANSDVLAAWFSEAAGRLQAVVQTDFGDWSPAHEDSESAGFAMLFSIGGQAHYVRLAAPQLGLGALRYDFGTWSASGGFVTAGATTGQVVAGLLGTVTLDVPASTGAVAGTRLGQPYVMTYDGGTSLAPHWVDRAPGGAGDATPTEAAFGADYVVGSCQPASGGASGPGGGVPPGPGQPVTTTAVVLTAPKRLVGGGKLRASGRVAPARANVPVRLTVSPRRKGTTAVVRTVATGAGGAFAYDFQAVENSLVNAVAEGVNAQTQTVTVQSTVSLELRRLASGKTVVRGKVGPRIPGRVLLLRANAVVPTATSTVAKGRFRFQARRLSRGRYEVVFIPSGARAERSTSKSGVVR
jgi:hypothetical protein